MAGTDQVLDILEFRHIESYWLFYLTVSWTLAFAAVAVLQRRRPRMHWPWHRTLGLVLVLWPFVQFTHEIIESIPRVLDPTSVAVTVPEWLWWIIVRRRTFQYVIMPLAGMFLLFGHHLHLRAWSQVGPRLRDTLQRMDMWPRAGWNRDTANGLGLFVLFFFGYVGLGIALRPLQRYDTGDESGVFDMLTPELALALALVAGITEELLFRGILQTQLARIMPIWGAISIQAVAFGLIHSGYGTVSHIVLPLLFGIAVGIIAYFFGVIPAIFIHVGVDLIIFLAVTTANGYLWTGWLIPLVFFGAISYALIYHVPRWMQQRQDDKPGSGRTLDQSVEWD